MDYEYDDDKSERTFRDRRIDFEFAVRVFDGDFIEYEDRRRDYGERRLVAIGPIDGRIFAVVYTWRNGRRRIISARTASRSKNGQSERDVPTIARSHKRHEWTGRVDWAKVDATTEADIARQTAEDPDTAPELTEDALDRAVIVSPDGTRTPYRERILRSHSSGLLTPGSRAPVSGVYRAVGPAGVSAGTQRTVTVARGERLPPTPQADQRWETVKPGRKASA